MPPAPIIIDCDPGQDDALAILLALASPEELEVLAITAVAGNVPLALTHANARKVVELSGRRDVPVHGGCDETLVKTPLVAEPRARSRAGHGVGGARDLPGVGPACDARTHGRGGGEHVLPPALRG